MIDYEWVGPCFGNDEFCLIPSTVFFYDANQDMQISRATTDRGYDSMPYQRFEVYYLA